MLDPLSIVAAISTANSAYATIKTGVSNLSEAWSKASSFIEAKAVVDLQATKDEESGVVTTEAFVRSIEYRRYEKEVDDIIRAFCDGAEIAMWDSHKEKLKAQAVARAEAATQAKEKARRIARRKQIEREENVRAALIALTIVAALMLCGGVLLLGTGIV